MTRELIYFIESLGWTVFTDKYADDEYELESYSPEGEDLIIEISKGSDEDVLEELKLNYENFDAEEHACMWYGKNRGEPSSLRVLLDDAQDIENMYRDLYVNVEDFLRRKDGND